MRDRRKYPRLKDGVKAIYKPMGEEGEHNLHVLDVSAGGLRLPVKQKLELGTILELKVMIPQTDESFFVLGKVVWQSPNPTRTKAGKIYYETGVEFQKIDLKERIRLIHYVHDNLLKQK